MLVVVFRALLDLAQAMRDPVSTGVGMWCPQGSASRTSIIILELDLVILKFGSELCSIVLFPVLSIVDQIMLDQLTLLMVTSKK